MGRRFFIIALLLFMTHDYPIVGYMTPPVVFLGEVLLVHLAALLYFGADRYFSYFAKIFPLTLILILDITRSLFSDISSVYTGIYGYFQVVIYYIVGLYLFKTNDFKLAKIIAIFLLVFYAITASTTYWGLSIFPEASRNMARNMELMDAGLYGQYMRFNIGGFTFIYYMVILIVLLVLLYKREILKRIWAALLLVLFSLTIIRSQYTTGLIIGAFGLILLFVPKQFGAKNVARYLLISSIAILLFWSVLPSFFMYLSGIVEGGEVAMRFEDLSVALDAGTINTMDETSDLAGRAFYYQRSLDAIIRSFPLGTWNMHDIGGHSYILVSIACYGLLGLIAVVVQFVRMFNLYIKPVKKCDWSGFLYLALLEVIVLALVNSLLFTAIIAFYVPLICVIINHKEAKRI